MIESISPTYTQNPTTAVTASAGWVACFLSKAAVTQSAEVIIARLPLSTTEQSVVATPQAADSHGRTYSMTDVLNLLNRKAREAFLSEQTRVNASLKSQYENREITTVAYYRAMARMTQEQVSTKSGIAQPYLSKIERGRARLSRNKAVQLAAALGVSAAQLLEIDDDQP
jgi:DNA-binding XRE family transcriptional regulator